LRRAGFLTLLVHAARWRAVLVQCSKNRAWISAMRPNRTSPLGLVFMGEAQCSMHLGTHLAFNGTALHRFALETFLF
jgi:hypothetical protein